jgi:3-hydroxyisobutyrate dehydrogenase
MPAVPSSRGYEGGFGAPLMVKDLGLALQLAEAAGQPAPLAEHARQLYQTVAQQRPPGVAPLDFSAVYEVVYGGRQQAA